MKTYNETRVNVTGVVQTLTDSTGKVTAAVNQDGTLKTDDVMNITEKKFQELVEDHKKNGWPEPQPTKVQTFSISEIESSVSEFEPYLQSLGLDAAVAAKSAADILQRGWSIEQLKEVRSFMLGTSEAVEGVYSVAVEAATPAERRVKDPLQGALNNLKKAGINLSLDDLKNLIAGFQAPAQEAQPVA